MTSERKIAANRRNTGRSTGPSTEESKAISSRNAVTHGLTASGGLLPGERPEDYSLLRDRIFARFAPGDALEDELVERIASLLWRLRRIPAFEAALFAWANACREEESLFASGEPRLTRRFCDDDVPARSDRTDILVFGRSLDAFLKRDLGAKLNRYESALQRQLSALMLEVRRMQARRYARGSPGASMEPAIGEGGVVVPLRAFGSQDAAGEADPERPKRLLD